MDGCLRILLLALYVVSVLESVGEEGSGGRRPMGIKKEGPIGIKKEVSMGIKKEVRGEWGGDSDGTNYVLACPL